MVMDLELRLSGNVFEVHVVDSASGRYISLEYGDLGTIKPTIKSLIDKYKVNKIYKSDKPVLVNCHI